MSTVVDPTQAVIDANKKAGYSSTPAANANSTTGLSADFNFFLRMLTTQLTNQDPTEPMDVSQMTQQIVQFSQVEQQVQSNSKLDALLASNKTVTYQSQLATAAGYIGREVETAGASGQVYAGQGAFSYILPETATSVEVTVKNSAGTIVYSGPGTTGKGRNVLLWDGVNSRSGKQEPDGVYSISVDAKDSKGATMKPETRSVWLVAGFETDKDGNVLLTVADKTVKFDEVLTVRPATRATFEYPDEDDTVTGGGDTPTDTDTADNDNDDTVEEAA